MLEVSVQLVYPSTTTFLILSRPCSFLEDLVMFGNAYLRTSFCSCQLSHLAFLVAILFSNTLFADEAEDRKKFAIVDIANVDRDFGFVGEYEGMVDKDGVKHPVGLQIVALGDGEFGGMYYQGGLPGSGWSGVEREKISGHRGGDLLSLESENARFEIVNGGPSVYSKDGRIIGELSKVTRTSPTLCKVAPSNAYTLFDGHDTTQFVNGKMTDDGLLIEGTELLSRFRDFTMHLEYRLPYMPYARGQDRGNSGVYLQSSYEVQVLDSFGLEGIENECGALYRYQRPNQNMCLPPLQWQTYDLTFRSPKFDAAGNKIQNARITLLHNGVAVHDNFELERKTGAGKKEADTDRPIKLQNHSNPIRYRNIWLIDLGRQQSHSASSEFVAAPVLPSAVNDCVCEILEYIPGATDALNYHH